jgi:hypothetical protein
MLKSGQKDNHFMKLGKQTSTHIFAFFLTRVLVWEAFVSIHSQHSKPWTVLNLHQNFPYRSSSSHSLIITIPSLILFLLRDSSFKRDNIHMQSNTRHWWCKLHPKHRTKWKMGQVCSRFQNSYKHPHYVRSQNNRTRHQINQEVASVGRQINVEL